MGWKGTIDDLLAERRQRLGEAPSLDELIALRAGTLDEAARERVLELAAADPAAVAALRDVLRFPETTEENVEGADETIPDADLDARWQAMRARLIAEGDLPAPGPSHATASPTGPRWLAWAASFLLGVGLAWLATHRAETPDTAATPAPQINLPIVELVPLDGDAHGVPRLRDGADAIVLADDAGGVVLTLAVPAAESAEARGPFSLAISRPDREETKIGGLAPGIGGVFVLTLPRADLDDGRHILTLRDAAGDSIARFAFEVAPPR